MESLPPSSSWLPVLCAAALAAVSPANVHAVDSVKIDVADDYHVGEAFQVRLAIPATAGNVRVFLQDPLGKVASLLPNEFEPLPDPRPRAFRWLIPQPGRGYEVILNHPGKYRVITLHARSTSLDQVQWPETLPHDEAPALALLRGSISTAGLDVPSRDLAFSTLAFTVREGTRPVADTLSLSVEGILDGLETPRFAPGSTELASSRDYRILWRWAALLRSPAHRHQKFLVECHAHQPGSRKENLALSEARAQAIVAYLVEKAGIPEERLSPSGKGDFEPLPDDGTLPPGAHDRVVLALDNTAGTRTLLHP